MADFHAIPEIASAIHSFVMSRAAVPGIYVYFDIGGGTLDGVAFDYLNDSGVRQINFYSGKVESLGTSALYAEIKKAREHNPDVTQLEKLLSECSGKVREEYKRKVQKLVAGVIMTAKRKDWRDWQRDAIQRLDYQQRFRGQLKSENMRPLVIFLGGGGCRSRWYEAAISATYNDFQHYNAGIPPYKLLQVPAPNDLKLDDGVDFTRFTISYGLSVPFGEGPEVRLPSHRNTHDLPPLGPTNR